MTKKERSELVHRLDKIKEEIWIGNPDTAHTLVEMMIDDLQSIVDGHHYVEPKLKGEK